MYLQPIEHKYTYFYIKKSSMMHLLALIQQIKARRDMLHLTQEQLAALAGIGLRTLKQFESGKGNPTLATLQKVTEVLGLELTLQLKKTN